MLCALSFKVDEKCQRGSPSCQRCGAHHPHDHRQCDHHGVSLQAQPAGEGTATAVVGKVTEQRATKAVVVLVTLYMVVYGVDNGIWVNVHPVRKKSRSRLICDLHTFFTLLYVALSTLVIIVSNTKVNSRLRCVVQEKPVLGKAISPSTM